MRQSWSLYGSHLYPVACIRIEFSTLTVYIQFFYGGLLLRTAHSVRSKPRPLRAASLGTRAHIAPLSRSPSLLARSRRARDGPCHLCPKPAHSMAQHTQIMVKMRIPHAILVAHLPMATCVPYSSPPLAIVVISSTNTMASLTICIFSLHRCM